MQIILRPVEADDLDFLYALESERSEGAFNSSRPSRQLLWQYIQNYSADIYAERQLRLIIADADNPGKTLGAVDLSDFDPHDRRAFVGIIVSPEYRRQGIASRALVLISDMARELGIHQLAALVAVDNHASRALFSGAGFNTAGSLRSWIRRGVHYQDALIYQKLFEN